MYRLLSPTLFRISFLGVTSSLGLMALSIGRAVAQEPIVASQNITVQDSKGRFVNQDRRTSLTDEHSSVLSEPDASVPIAEMFRPEEESLWRQQSNAVWEQEIEVLGAVPLFKVSEVKDSDLSWTSPQRSEVPPLISPVTPSTVRLSERPRRSFSSVLYPSDRRGAPQHIRHFSDLADVNTSMGLDDGWQSLPEQQEVLKSRLLPQTDFAYEASFGGSRLHESDTVGSNRPGMPGAQEPNGIDEDGFDDIRNDDASDDEASDVGSINDAADVTALSADEIEALDPELGILRLRPVSEDISGTESSTAVIDPELGILRVRAIPPPPTKQPFLFFQGNLSFFNGNNLLARIDPISDTTLQSGLTLRAVPRIGPRTFLVGSAGGSVLRYASNGEFDYRQLDLSAGVYHWLSRRAYLDVNWRNQQFFAENGGDRFLDDHQLRASLGRNDTLLPSLALNSGYTLQSSWSNPEERSRLTHRFNLGLSHALSEQTEASLSYQMSLIDFTQQDRYDSYHQLLAQLQFNLSEETRLTLFGGGRLGDSSHSLIDFDTTLLGVSLVLNLSLF